MCDITNYRFAKSFALLTTILSLIYLTPLSAQWEIINDGSDLKVPINTIDFVNEDIGWIAGRNGTLLKTTDGGENWNTINIPDSISIKHIDFLNESIGWAVGNTYIDGRPWTNHIWKTTTGGSNWMSQFSFEFGSIYVIDENNVFAFGSNIYKTTNGGISWTDVSPNLSNQVYSSLWFQNAHTGVATSYSYFLDTLKAIILKTTNGGITWDETIADEYRKIYDLQFVDNSNGYFRAQNDSNNFICKTEDMGATWTVKTRISYRIHSYQLLDNNLIYAVMDDSVSRGNKHFMKSTDGAVTWDKIYTFKIYDNINKIYFSSPKNGFIYVNMWESFPALFKSSDYGESWVLKKSKFPLMDVLMINEDNLILAGGFSACGLHGGCAGIFFSMNNGINSLMINYSGFEQITSLHSMNDNIIFATVYCCGIDRILKSDNNGSEWTTVYDGDCDSAGFSFAVKDICFADEQTGFAIGVIYKVFPRWVWTYGAIILTTTNSGNSWELGWKYPDTTINNIEYHYNLQSICFTPAAGWSVGESGMILKYNPQTGWVQQSSVTDLPLNKVFFSDENHGWIVGGYHNELDDSFQSILLKTTNGGVNWITVPNVPYLFRDISFLDNNLGWAIGYDSSSFGGILETIDGGITWTIDTGNLPSKLNALHIKDTYGWAVGENGLILRTTDAGAVWVEDESDNSLPAEFVLEQNYPNPFNPNTVISYQLPVNSDVLLKVFDVLGKEIATLVDEYKTAGRYEIEFDASRLASGIYFYQLKAGDYTAVKKMILLR